MIFINQDVMNFLLFFSGFILGNCLQLCCCHPHHPHVEDDISDTSSILDRIAFRRAIDRIINDRIGNNIDLDDTLVDHVEPSAPSFVTAEACYIEEENVVNLNAEDVYGDVEEDV